MGKYRWVRTMPVVFSPVDPRVLYLGANVVFKTLNGGERWQTISPDLTRPTAEVPASLGAFAPLDPEQGRHRGVIYTIAPSFTRPGLLWVGTDDGLIHVTHDGGRRWTVVTGNRCGSTCRRARCATSSCATPTWSWRRMDARSGSSTTSPRCARSRRPPLPPRREALICTARRPPFEFAGTATPTRRSPPTSPRAGTHPTARCSTTTGPAAGRAR